jgi:hypothetical protein
MMNPSPVRSDKNRGRRHERLGEAWFVAVTLKRGGGNLIELIAITAAGEKTLLMSPQGPRLAVPPSDVIQSSLPNHTRWQRRANNPWERRNGPGCSFRVAQAMGITSRAMVG